MQGGDIPSMPFHACASGMWVQHWNNGQGWGDEEDGKILKKKKKQVAKSVHYCPLPQHTPVSLHRL